MTDPKPILWMRRKTLPNKPKELFHIERANYPTHDIHYFYTLCHKEIKGLYWDIVENPPIDQCCPECLAFIKSGEPPWW